MQHVYIIKAGVTFPLIADRYDARIMRSYIEQMADELTKAGQDVPQLLSRVTDTPQSRGILRRFGEMTRRESY